MQVLLEEQRTRVTSMAIKNPKIAYSNLWIQHQVLNHTVGILHLWPGTNIVNNSDVESVYLKLKTSDHKMVPRQQFPLLISCKPAENLGSLLVYSIQQELALSQVKINFKLAL